MNDFISRNVDDVSIQLGGGLPYFLEFGRAFFDSEADKAPFYSVFTPVRFMHKDILFAATVARRNRTRFEVALMLVYDVSGIKRFEGARAALTHVLTQAYAMTGKPEVHFVGVESLDSFPKVTTYETTVPNRIGDALYQLGLVDGSIGSATHISASLGRYILLFYAEIGTNLQDQLVELQIEPLRVAMQIFRNVWTISDIKLFIQHCLDPRAVITGVLDPMRKGFSFGDLSVAGLSVMHQRLRVMFDEQDEVLMDIHFEWGADTYLHFTTINEHTLRCAGGDLTVPPDTSVVATFLPYDVAGFCAMRSLLFANIQELVNEQDSQTLILVVTTADFKLLPKEERAAWKAAINFENVGLVSIIDTKIDLLREVESRFKHSRSWAANINAMSDGE
jgi:hypothetical protein